MATVFTQVGEEWVIDILDGTLSPGTHYVSGGTGAGSAAKGNTTLSTEVTEARAAATKSQPTADKAQWAGTQAYTGTKTVTNCGVLTASSGGILLVHGDGLSIAVNNGDSIAFTITLEMT